MNLTFFRPNFRNLVVGIDTQVPLQNGRQTTAVNFDNAASTPPFVAVLNEIIAYCPWYSSIHRGKGYKSQFSSHLYDESRRKIAEFVHADAQEKSIIFVKNTTEAINKLSYRLYEEIKDGMVLATAMEHHSNDLPWRNKCQKVVYGNVDQQGKLDLNDLEDKLKKHHGKIKLVAITGASNVTGNTNPVHLVASLAHQYGAKILVDGAQLVPHAPIDMQGRRPGEHLDYLAFSAHKMYAPFGTGVLIGPRNTFSAGAPEYRGGGTINLVTHDYIAWADPPEKEEAGTPNVIGVVALVKAIETLQKIGMANIEKYELNLTDYALRKLRRIPDLQIYGNSRNTHERVGIISFNLKELSHDLTADILSHEAGIAVRNGCFCANPYVQQLLHVPPEEMQKYIQNPGLPHPGMVRVSFGLYNTYGEIDQLADTLNLIVQNKRFFQKKYQGKNTYRPEPFHMLFR
ncbi:MAG: aminotransferase class V-fold PLP-dependent enzyme [Peptococcaceae bacterium]